jgi:hypothetical protein
MNTQCTFKYVKLERLIKYVLAVILTVGILSLTSLSAYASGWSRQTLDASTGFGTTSINYGGNPHVFDFDGDGRLRHCWWTGSSWPCEQRDSQTGGKGRIAAVVTGTQLHVFYNYLYNIDASGTRDYRLAHQWYDTSWHFEFLGPHYSAGMDVSATVYGGNPHVFYPDYNGGALRHAWWTGSSWQFEYLDGNAAWGGSGRTKDVVGDSPSTVVYGTQLHVFYNDSASGALRHAWYNWGGSWGFENLDGPGSWGGNGRIGSRVTSNNNGSVALLYQNLPHVFFTANGPGLRHCMWSGSAWYCETIVQYNFSTRVGSDPSSQPAAATWGTTLQLYYGQNNDLMHRNYTPGYGWNVDMIDSGSFFSPVGDWPSALEWGGQPHVFYQGHHDLDHMWWSN